MKTLCRIPRNILVLTLCPLLLSSSFAQDKGPTEEQKAAFRARMANGEFGGPKGGSNTKGADSASSTTITTQRVSKESIPTLQTDVTRAAAASEVAVNWENISLKECIEVLCRDLGMEFIISPSVNVSQEVSIRAGDVTEWEYLDKLNMFDAILETAGVQRISRGRVWVFAPSDIRPVVHAFDDSSLSEGQPIIGILELQHLDCNTAAAMLNNLAGKPERVFALGGTRLLMVLGTQAYLHQLEELILTIDVPPSKLAHFQIQTADATDIATELSSIFYQRTGGDGSSVVQFFPITRLNMVVAHNAPSSMLPEIEKWIKMLDRSDAVNERVTKIYRMQVVEAETIGDTLSELYSDLYTQQQTREQEMGKTTAKNNTTKTNSSTNKNKTNSAKNTKTTKTNKNNTSNKASTANSDSGSSSVVDEEVIVLSDEDTNTLIINAPASMHTEIAKTIKELDRSRRQVLIETVLVEVTLDESMDLGVEWTAQGTANPTHSGALLGGLGISDVADGNIAAASDGLTYLLESSDNQMALIHAAQDDDRLQVLSSPTVLTRDGMEAEISFGEEVPIAQKTSDSTGEATYTYDYRDAKITLTVTPHIDENRMVTLDLEQTLRSINPDTIDDEAPKFYTRELSSNLQVDDGQTLVLGGLIQRNDQKVRTGIPFLSQIPGIGWAFGRTKTVKVGSEILMILTPHVVDTRSETDLLTREFQHKILGALQEKNIRDIYGIKDEEEEAPAEDAPAIINLSEEELRTLTEEQK